MEGEIVYKYPLTWNLISWLEMYYTPALVAFGSLGNCLSVYVVFASKMRRTSSSVYLAALALSDTGFLMSVLIAWLGLVNVNLINRQGFCQLFVYLPNVCSFLSAWFVVAFTVERFVAVCYPLRRQWMCTVNRARMLVSGVCAGGAALCSPVLLYTRPMYRREMGKEVCYIAPGWENAASVLNFVDTVLTFALPFCLIVVLNSLIVRAVWNVDGVRRTRASDKSSPPAVHQARVTKMLLVVSSVFFCFNLPSYAMRIYAYLQAEGATTELEFLTQRAFNLLFNTNFGISFGLYCASGQNFRSAVAQLFRCRGQGRSHPQQFKRYSTNQTNQQGTETMRIAGLSDQSVGFGKPWRSSLQMKQYPRPQQGDTSEDATDYSEGFHYSLRKECNVRV